MSILWGVSLVHCFQVEFEVGNVGFCEWGKTGEKSSEPTREPTTNSTLMWRHVRASNLGHSGGRQVRSPQRHPRYSYLKKNNVHRLQRSMQPKQTILIIEFTSSRFSLSETLTLKQNSSTYTEEILVLAAGWSVSLWWELLRRFRRFCGGSQGAGIFSISLYLLYCFIFVFFLFFRILLMFLFYFCQCNFCGYCLL